MVSDRNFWHAPQEFRKRRRTFLKKKKSTIFLTMEFRAKGADVCLDYGLERVQDTAFLGELNKTHQRELWLKIERRIRNHAASVHLYPLDEKSWVGCRVLACSEEGI